MLFEIHIGQPFPLEQKMEEENNRKKKNKNNQTT